MGTRKSFYFGTKQFSNSAYFEATIPAAEFLQVPPKSSFKKLLLSTGLWQYAKMSTTLKSPDRLKDAECKKGQLSNWPPILYVPVTDIVTPKEDLQVHKVKLPDNSYINMHIYSRGNNEEYLTHIVAVLRFIKQRGLGSRCRKLKKAVLKQSKMLKNLLETPGSRDTVLTDVDVMACKVEIEQSQQLLQDFQKAHNKAIAKVYKQLQNLLSGNLQAQWDRACCEMHERDSWAGMSGQVTKGRRPRTWMSFRDYLELHKLTVFSADAAKRQRFYIQQAVRKHQRATVPQYILQMGVLNDHVRHLPLLKDSPKAVPKTKKGNIHFGKAVLATIVLASVPMSRQN
jgi:hypothetical protein